MTETMRSTGFILVLFALTMFTPHPGAVSATDIIKLPEWKTLSTEEKVAVNDSLNSIISRTMQSVTLRILNDAGIPYTGSVHLTQDSTSFISMAGYGPYHMVNGAWVSSSEYFKLTPSRSYYIYAPWKEVERIKGTFDFGTANSLYAELRAEGMTDFHVEVGPYLTAGEISRWNSLPDWAKSLDFNSLRAGMKGYVEALTYSFKGRVQYYHLWTEANAAYGNWPIERIIDIIGMEADAIHAIDSRAKVCIDLDNISQGSLRYLGGNTWTTEDFVQRLLAAAVFFDVIGLEPHYGDGSPSRAGGIDTLYHRLIDLAKFGKPIFIWEDGLPSFIEPQYLTDQEWWGLRYLWHGVPSEEKQAEYMLAETIVALGNPSVIGLRFGWLYDEGPNQPLFWHHFSGVLYGNGTMKRSFNTIEEFWNTMTTNSTIYSDNGVATFRGLTGNYTIRVEGYQPFAVHVPGGVITNLTITLIPKKTQFSTTTTIGTSLSTSAISQQTVPFEGPTGLYLVPLAVVFMALVVATVLWSHRKKRTSKR